MKLARVLGVVAVALAILGYVISVRLAVLIFLLLAACIVYFVFIWPNVRQGK